MKKYISIMLLVFLIITVALPIYAQNDSNNIKAEVIQNKGIEEIKEEKVSTKKVQNVTVRILEGEYENEEYDMQYVLSENIENITSNSELKEDDNILVQIEEKDGEVTKINYIETINSSYILYILGAIFIVIVLIIGGKEAIKPIIIYLLTILLVSCIFIFSIQRGWNLILISGVLSLLITICVLIKGNGINKKTASKLLCAVIGISIAGILMYVLFDIMNLTNINIKIAEEFIDIKELICSGAILFGCGIYNSIMTYMLNISYSTNKAYKTKSDNIIEGQRSLKL